ncbi:MAG: hypothetical protein HQL64_02185 [Magnetococcales bacterium]|nr:hypothetical protein [Magnetococcales bacterium]
MTIRRVDHSGKSLANSSVKKQSRTSEGTPGEKFTRVMDALAPMEGPHAVNPADEVLPADSDSSSRQRRQQLQQTDELLDSLQELEQGLQGKDPQQEEKGGQEEDLTEQARLRLRETRDQALRSLTETPAKGEERDLLHRTAVLATVELAKTDRGDYK